MRAKEPDLDGYVERDGVKVFYEVFGSGEPTILLFPAWSIVHSRIWKMQVPYLARHYRVTFDGRGNGRSDRPPTAAAYSVESCARVGASRPSARSKYARRTAGPAFTTASRSGVNTSVATSERNCSAARSGAPFTFARLLSPSSSVTSSCTSLSPLRPYKAIRPARSPKRTSCASARVRGEKPCVPTCSDSSKFVLPAPFGPTTSTSPDSRFKSRRAYDRTFRSETVETIRRASRATGWA